MKYVFLLLALFCIRPAFAAVNLLDKDDWKVDMSGFIETDLMYDTTRSFNEKIGNAPVQLPNGTRGETQMSVRNSRLAFNIQAPTIENVKTRGYFEFDFLGYDPTPGNQAEASFFDSPTMRIRHAYVEAKVNDWQFLTGQTWNLMGWQPYYFIPSLQVAPIPGMLYDRTPQIRAMRSMEAGSSLWQFAAGIMRPPERVSSWPALEAGARWSLENGRKAAFTGGGAGAHNLVPLSVGISGTVRDLEVANDGSGNTNSQTGYGVALDFLVPVLASSDGQSTKNNLIIGGEFTSGQGYGDQFDSWTGNQFSPLNSAAKGSFDSINPIDAGIVGYDQGGYTLVQLQTFNLYAQYHLPWEAKTSISAGYSQLFSSNIGQMDDLAKSLAYDKEESMFINIAHDCTKWIRVGFEYAMVKTSYDNTFPNVNGAGATPVDNRFQFSSWFIF